jgi:3-hydroxybutyryl-CoA dehydrogenase
MTKEKNMIIKNVTIAGAGVLGSQVAWQTALHGFNVFVFDICKDSIEKSKELHKQFAELFLTTRGASQLTVEAALNRINYTTDLAEAVNDADIISESVPESIEVKADFYRMLSQVAPKKTIFTTNSSSLLPSQFAQYTGRPKKFVALHFANGIWDANVGEVMGHADTSTETFDRVVKFAEEIGMVPIPIHKEQNGYVLNSLLIPLLSAAGDLLVGGVATPETIDKTWMISTGVKMGPFATMDIIGMQTMYNLDSMWGKLLNDPQRLARAEYIDEHFIKQGKMGVQSGEGFYKYPNPAYAQEHFLS